MTKGIRAARKEARPSEILEAAFEEFAIRGYSATNVEHIAARAGVTKGTIYFYFQSKEDVFENMVAELAQPCIDLSSYLNVLGKKQSIEIMLDILGRICEILLDDRHKRVLIRFLIAESNLFQDLRRKNREKFALPIMNAIEEVIRYGCDNGEFRKEAAEVDALVLLSAVLGMNVMEHVDPEITLPPPRFTAQYLSIVRYFLVDPEAARAPHA
jgi:AcrR family transcriptional regulator